MICSLFRGRRVHLLGIGGSGVSALVPLLQAVGAVVSGCDAQDSPIVAGMRARGIDVHLGHHPQHVHDVDMVVHTAAVAAEHPELTAARERGIPVMTRGQCLIELMRGTRTVAISGSHGKTSTTWMIGHLLSEAGRDPVVMVGGSVASLGGGARTGTGDLFIAETDESDGSFAGVDPEVAILTNLDREHVQYYGDFSHLEERFREWLSRIPASGLIVVPSSGLSPRVLAGVKAQVLRCGLDDGDCHAEQLELSADGSRMHVILHGQDLGEVRVPLPGSHMAHNALMAIAAARYLQPDCPLEALGKCERVRRRFTIHSAGNPPLAGVRVVEDYGHHPTEIRATIAAARLAGGRVHVLFQPHRYSRTADLFPDFVTAFDRAGAVVFLPIYAASEMPIPGIDSRLLADSVREHRDAHAATHFTFDREEAVELIAHEAEEGDTILVLGAGDVGELAPVIAHFFPCAGLGNAAAAGPHQREVA